ncbi:MAG: hypothetical protein KHZ99_15925 [Clostridium sp.]|uniref:hypothetical protein n=1 Tax=Clostridium sp. TaxID=1506 RepID=UPI0025B9C63C|nr:hypothetical protein [Clostridium sp.]MBS4958512.1 hypothetical protein [Clostridium sp.]
MFIRKKRLLAMIEVLNSEVANLKNKLSEFESFNNTKKINFNIDGKRLEEIYLDSKGLIVKGKINIDGFKGEY